MKTKPNGLIILKHTVLGEITDQEIWEALPEAYQNVPQRVVSISPEMIRHGETQNLYWKPVLEAQERLFLEKVKPVLEECQGYKVLYFGLAPIPLAIHLGFQIRSFTKVEVFLKHHGSKSWKWPPLSAGKPIEKEIPQDKNKAPGDVSISLATSLDINPEDYLKTVENPIKEISIRSPKVGRNIFGSHNEVQEYATSFQKALDAISGKLPGVENIHFFAAVPVGLAMLIGQEISPTAHAKVHIYEYVKDETIPYRHVVAINGPKVPPLLSITKADIDFFSRLYTSFQEELGYIQDTVLTRVKEENASNWLEAIYPDVDQRRNPFALPYWQNLARIDQCDLITTLFSKEKKSLSSFDEQVLKHLSLGMNNKEEDIQQALRLFCYHETCHQAAHGVLAESLKVMQAYPRVMEEANYQADVYALLHEFFLNEIPFEEAVEEFKRMIHALTKTLWAFDKQFNHTEEMPVHSVNRYLTWYYIQSQLELGNCETLEEILSLLSTKPLLELQLNSIQSKGERAQQVVYDFKHANPDKMGMTIFHQGKVKSYGNRVGLCDLSNLITGFRTHQPEMIQQVIRSLITTL